MIKKFLPSVHRSLLATSIRSFCVYGAYLNPERHITMAHNLNNAYEDIVMIGDYMIPSTSMKKEISRDYIPHIVNTVITVVKSKHPELKLNVENYEDLKSLTWNSLGVADIDSLKQEILEALATSVYIKENKFRYTVEQRIRLANSVNVYSKFKLDQYLVAFLVETYNALIRLDIDRSNLWREPKIKGDLSFLEKYEAKEEKKGVSDLKRDIKENKNWINKILDVIHSN